MYTPAKLDDVLACAYDAWLSYCEETGEPGLMDNEEQMNSYIDEYVSHWKFWNSLATDQ